MKDDEILYMNEIKTNFFLISHTNHNKLINQTRCIFQIETLEKVALRKISLIKNNKKLLFLPLISIFFLFFSAYRRDEALAIRSRFPTKVPVSTLTATLYKSH